MTKATTSGTENKGYSILSKESLYNRNRHVVRLHQNSTITHDELLQDLDSPYHAPFGGTVHSNGDGTLTVDVYTD